jgi:hypothetical protein
MRAHKTKKRENRIPKPILLFGFWGEPARWNKGAPPKPRRSHIVRNIGLGQVATRMTTWDASWATEESA